MQALYMFFQSDTKDLAKGERELFNGIEKIYDLYIYQLALLIELRHVATILMEDAKTKYLPTKDNLNPNLKFIQNKFIENLAENINLKREINNRKISWNNEFELVKKIFNNIKTSPEFDKYMNVDDDSYNTNRDFIIEIFRERIADFELLNNFYEEKDIHWGDDIYLVNPMVEKTIEKLKKAAPPENPLIPLYKDKEEDQLFVKDLYCQTILRNEEVKKLIGDKTKNWEMDRIAMMDVLLMKMALIEILHFENIPVKVSLNEFIEISKMYSTPKSKIFINGILDKLVYDLRKGDLIKKTGRGLIMGS